MALSQTQVSQLYVCIFGRASEGEGNTFWQQNADMVSAATDMLATSQAVDYFGDTLTDNQAFIEHIYLNTLGKTYADDPDGVDYWVGRLDAGESQGTIIADLISAAQAPENAGDAQDQFNNKVAVSNYVADNIETVTTLSEFADFIDEVDHTDASVTDAIEDIDDMLDDTDPGETGDTFTLTSGTDRGTDFEGTSDNDTFDAPIAQNSFTGGVSNSLSSADELDGGAGTDTLNAELVDEFVGATTVNYTIDVQPETTSIEDINIEARDFAGDTALGAAGNVVTLDAKHMTGIDEIGSYYSDGDLVIENLTTLTDGGSARNTSDLTITMDHTDNFNTDNDASDLTVYFDEDYLLNDEDTSGAQLEIRLLNAVQNEAGNNPVEGFSEITFTVGGVEVSVDITSIADDDTLDYTTAYDEIVDAINAQLDADGFDDVTASLATIEDAVFSIPVAGFSTGDDAGDYYPIIVTNTGSEELAGVDIETSALSYDTDLNNSFQASDPETTQNPVSVNVELEKVGRDAEGGDLVIGGKSNDGFGDTDVDQVDGIELFNISVLGGEDKPSNLGLISSTNQSLDTVTIESAEPGQDSDGANTWADLTVRTQLGQGQELTLIDSTDFNGDFALGLSIINIADVPTPVVTGVQQALTSNFGSGNDSYNWQSVEADTNDDDGNNYSISMGAGNDTVFAELDGDSVDALGESFNLVTGNGNDTVVVDMTNGVSYRTMAEISSNQETYLDINTGDGNDRVALDDYGTFDIVTGAGDDYIEIDANDATDLSGEWSVFANTGADTFERVLYNAKMTVSFAGFETTIDINTTSANNYVATQAFIASEIQRAIESDDTLSEFLTVNIAAGTNQVTITSDIDGENSLGIALFQPELLATGTATADQTVIDSGDVSALRQGLLATETVAGLSADLENETEIATWTNNNANAWEGQVSQTGVGDNTDDYSAAQLTNDTAETAPDGENDLLDEADFLAYSIGNVTASANDATVVNFSTINAGADDDIIVLDSNVASMNTIVVDSAFGYDRVVNFFDDNTDDVNLAAEVGDHRIDFSAYLVDTVDTSGEGDVAGEDSDSAVLADTNVVLATGERSFADAGVHGATVGTNIDANDVAVIRFDSSDADNTAETFDSLNGTILVNALNGDQDTTGDSAYANLAAGTLEAVAVTDYTNATQNHIIMVENDLNEGEYKVFHVTSTIDTDTDTVTDGDFTFATELGTFDFGASVNLAISQEESVMAALQAAINTADGVAPVDNTAPVVEAQTFSVDENSAAGTDVGNVVASDADGDALTYTLQPNANFTINSTTGALAVAEGAVLDFETTESYTINVRVSDAEGFDTAALTINLNDVDESGSTTQAVDATTAAAALSAAGSDVTYTIAQATYTQEITNFAAGDVLDFPAGNNPTVNNTSFTDGAVDVQFALAGTVTTIQLTGLDAATDVQLNGVADFDTVFGAGTII